MGHKLSELDAKRRQAEAELAAEKAKVEMLRGIDNDVGGQLDGSCPDVRVQLSRGKVEILRPITFEKGKSRLVGNGKNILGQVAKTLHVVEKVAKQHNLP